jgi:hypothetical protein
MRSRSSLLVLGALLLALAACADIQGRNDCFGQVITDRCLGSPSWTMAQSSGLGG